MTVAVVIAAFNEAGRVGDVVSAARRARLVDHVFVVDDGSADNTADEAEAAGAHVLRLGENRGKGQAMLEGVAAADVMGDDVVCFLDADLKGLTGAHVDQIVYPVLDGRVGMVVGVIDYGADVNAAVRAMPLISGQRAVSMKVLRSVPEKAWDGYGIEVWLNDTAARVGEGAVVFTLEGVTQHVRWEKDGDRGVAKLADMGARVVGALEGIVDHYEEAPKPVSMEAQCSSTSCVTDALASSFVRAARPLWTADAQARVGEGVGKRLEVPLYGVLGVACAYCFGVPGAVVAGLVYAVTREGRDERRAGVVAARVLGRGG